MRSKSALILLLIVAMTVMPMSVIGQEEPLPVVTAREVPLVDAFVPAPMVFLAAEPIRVEQPPTLLQAARANDYATFDAIFRELKARGESLGTFETLHELWTYSVTDPIGAFYGTELHDRLARVYPGYAAFIDEHRIVDDRGAVFYPTSETRAFLLDRVNERNAPRVLIADAGASTSRSERATSVRSTRTENESAPRATSGRRASASGRVSSTAAPRTTATTEQTRRQNASSPAGRESGASLAAAPAAQKTSVPQTPVVAEPTPVVTTPPVVEMPAPVVATTPQPGTQQPAQPVDQELTIPIPAASDNLASRGILLIVIGLIGIGLLALMLRSPKQPVTVLPAQKVDATPKAAEGTGPKAPVEPLRRPAEQQAKSDSNRATGSHG